MFDIENLNDEYFLTVQADELLKIKSLSTEDKIKCFRFFLNSNVITNFSAITNLFLLINGIGGIEESSLCNEKMFFNDLEEYIDIKLKLKKDIENFKKKLLEYYLGVVQGLNVKLPELKVHITNTHYNILFLTNPLFISKLMLEYLKYIDVNTIKPTFNAESIYNKINDHVYSHTFGILQRIVSETINEDI